MASDSIYFLIGDLGGTNTRWWVVPCVKPAHPRRPEALFTRRYATASFSSFDALVQAIVDDLPSSLSAKVAQCTLAACGPVDPATGCALCLAPCMAGGWLVQPDILAKALALPKQRIHIINDFVAVGLALPLVRDVAQVLHPGDGIDPTAPIACLGPGTGLGSCLCVPQGDGFRVLPSEGGMSDYVPRTQLEWELRQHIARALGLPTHVEVERVISGPGLRNIYAFLASHGAHATPASTPPSAVAAATVLASTDPARTIAEHGVRGCPAADELCCRALDLFLAALGSEAANLALRFLPRGGVMLAGGGIVGKLRASIGDGRVTAAYLDKGASVEAYRGIPLLALDAVDGDTLGQLGAWQHAWQRYTCQAQPSASPTSSVDSATRGAAARVAARVRGGGLGGGLGGLCALAGVAAAGGAFMALRLTRRHTD